MRSPADDQRRVDACDRNSEKMVSVWPCASEEQPVGRRADNCAGVKACRAVKEGGGGEGEQHLKHVAAFPGVRIPSSDYAACAARVKGAPIPRDCQRMNEVQATHLTTRSTKAAISHPERLFPGVEDRLQVGLGGGWGLKRVKTGMQISA